MKVIYKNCEIECTREKALSGDKLLFFSVFDIAAHDPGLEITSGYTEGKDTVREYIGYMKEIVDNYIEHPEDYK